MVRNIAKPMKETVESMQTFGKRIVSAVDLKKLKASEIICNITKKGCFVAGTLVKTKDGYKRIEEIGANDFVYSWNEKENKMEYKRVLNTSITTAEITRLIELKDGTTVEATLNHPFLEIEKGFLEAKDLEIGSRIFTIEGEMEITSIKEEEYFSKKVYNLYVEDNHNYFISELGLLVHNEEITCLEQAKKVIEQLRKALLDPNAEEKVKSLRKDILDYFKKRGEIKGLSEIDKIKNKAIDVGRVREFLDKNKKAIGNYSIAVAEIKGNDGIEHILAVSGKSWKGGETVLIDGINYKVILKEKEEIMENIIERTYKVKDGLLSIKKNQNYNHAEKKLMAYIQEKFSNNRNIKIDMAIQNTFSDLPGICHRCSVSVPKFIIDNFNFDITVFQGSI